MRARISGTLAAAALLVTAAAGCGGSKSAAASAGAGPATSANSTLSSVQAPALSGSVTVLAAASLTGTFTQIGKDFEAAHPGVKVTFSFGGSSTLAAQIDQGAPADVFASASPANMKQVSDAGGVDGTPATFVRNQLVIAVAKGDPLHVSSLADLARPGVKVVECAVAVPCGAAAAKALAAAKVALTPVSQETDVKAALAKLTLGEADAALVYRTDALSVPDKVDGVEFPESAQAVNDYPIAVLSHAADPAAAKAFVAFVQSDPELAVLTRAGFQRP